MLSAGDFIEAWEQGSNLHAVDGTLYLLSWIFPEESWSDLSAVSVGRRNQHLLELHTRLFGHDIECRVSCPECACELEFTLDTRTLGTQAPPDQGVIHALSEADVEVRFRLLDSRDLAAAADFSTVEQARQALVARSLVSARRGGAEVLAEELPESTVAALADELERLDPPMAWRLSLACDTCGREWSANLDLARYMWQKVALRARHALGEVHELAGAYCWSEADILGMSDARRQHYLSLVRG